MLEIEPSHHSRKRVRTRFIERVLRLLVLLYNKPTEGIDLGAFFPTALNCQPLLFTFNPSTVTCAPSHALMMSVPSTSTFFRLTPEPSTINVLFGGHLDGANLRLEFDEPAWQSWGPIRL